MGIDGTGVCELWTTAEQVKAIPRYSGLDDDVIERFIPWASVTLFNFTGKKFTGLCSDEAFPCSGAFRRDSRCYCDGVVLDIGMYPLVEVVQIVIDGETFDADNYTLRDDRYIIRTDGHPWPRCYDHAASDEGFVVFTRYGRRLPPGAREAAAILTGELAKAYEPGDDCRLPRRVRTVTRQDVTIAVLDPMDMFDRKLTGLPEVDLFIRTYSDEGAGPTGVYVPEFHSRATRETRPWPPSGS